MKSTSPTQINDLLLTSGVLLYATDLGVTQFAAYQWRALVRDRSRCEFKREEIGSDLRRLWNDGLCELAHVVRVNL